MNKENTATRLKRLMSERNLRQIDILNLAKPYCEKYNVKMNKSDISQYCAGKTEPNQNKLFVLGMALNVSEAWLMGFDVPKERTNTPISTEADGRSKEFVELFNHLNEEQQSLILHAIKGLLSD